MYSLAAVCASVYLEPVFSNPPVVLSPLQNSQVLPQNYPLKPLCPPYTPLPVCGAMSSFSVMRHFQNGGMKPDMLTPFMTEAVNISKKRLQSLLASAATGTWISWDYSEEDHRYKRISEEERERPRDSYYRVHTNRDRVITENKTSSGEVKIHEGNLRAIRTADAFLQAIDNVPDNTAPEEKQKASEVQTADAFLQAIDNVPDNTTPEEKQKASEEEEKIKPQEAEAKPPETQQEWLTSRPTRPVRIEVPEGGTPSPSAPSCVDFRNNSTEAGSVCTECLDESREQLAADFQSKLRKKVESMICISEDFNSIIKGIRRRFNSTCKPTDFDDYVKNTLICDSCKSRVPPALMLSMISLESAGSCSARGDESGGHRSLGLFQIYSKFHTRRARRVCPGKSFKDCVSDPVSGLKVSMEIIKESYSRTNGRRNPTEEVCSSNPPNPPKAPSDSWRKALAAYNAGHTHINNVERQIRKKPEGISDSAWKKMSKWEKMRVYYFISCRRGRWACNNAISNLAHVEAGLGRSNTDSAHPSLFQSWAKLAEALGLKSLNDNTHCSSS